MRWLNASVHKHTGVITRSEVHTVVWKYRWRFPFPGIWFIFVPCDVHMYDLHLYQLNDVKVKGKCTLVQALKLCTGRTAHRRSSCIALLFLDHGTKRRWGISVTPQPLFTPAKDPVPTVQEAGWAPGPVWTGAENLALTGIRSPGRPARSQSLYWLRYFPHTTECCRGAILDIVGLPCRKISKFPRTH
jgi:hypothetical protein